LIGFAPFIVIPEVNGLITVTRVWSDCLLSVLPSLYRRMPGSAVCWYGSWLYVLACC
ncbi:hypothetical protein PDJAM_G00098830, partial [Pangasius djambal]|nr:hypothetical protein [Pangasius djambal]